MNKSSAVLSFFTDKDDAPLAKIMLIADAP